MLTLFVIGLIAYIVVGVEVGGRLLYSILDDDKHCIACWHTAWSFIWIILPFTLYSDLRG